MWVGLVNELLACPVDITDIPNTATNLRSVEEDGPETKADAESAAALFIRREGAVKASNFLASTNCYRECQEGDALKHLKIARLYVYHIVRRLAWAGDTGYEVIELLLNSDICQHVTDDIRHGMDLNDIVCTLILTVSMWIPCFNFCLV